MSLFEYYLDSRKIGQSYDKLTDLMVYDRVKSCPGPSFISLCSVAWSES